MRVLEMTTAGATTVRIAPDLGGAVTSFTLRGMPVLRETPAAALAEHDVRRASSYPLVPFSNRIRDARLAFAGRVYALARKFGVHPHAIHGVGWQRPWRIDEALPNRVQLGLLHDARGAHAAAWPWPFRASQTFELAERLGDGMSHAVVLSMTSTLENLGSQPFPFGLGWHPFFPVTAATELAFDADGVWENDETLLPVRRVAVPAKWRFDRPRSPSGIALDNVFTGWDGSATLADPATGMRTRLAADRACRYLVVYAPAGADFIAIEPVTHETDAFNRSAGGAVGTGTRTLPPGAAFSCTMRVAASAPDQPASPVRSPS